MRFIECVGCLLGACLVLSAAGDALAAPQAFANEVLSDSPLAYYRLGEASGATTALDASGNLHHGMYSASGVALGQSLLPGDEAVLFTTGRVTVPDMVSLNPAVITMEGVVSWNGSSGVQQRIMEKSTEPSGTHPVFSFCVLDDGGLLVELQTAPPTATASLASISKLTDATPRHVAATFDGSVVSIYVDGILDATTPHAGTLDQGTSRPLGVGNQAERDRPFNGIIDEAAIYGVALGADRILAHANALASTGGSGGAAGAGGVAGSAGSAGSAGDSGQAGQGANGGAAGVASGGNAGSSEDCGCPTTVEIDGGCSCTLVRTERTPAYAWALALAVVFVRRRR